MKLYRRIEKESTKDLTIGELMKLILVFALPLLEGFLFQ